MLQAVVISGTIILVMFICVVLLPAVGIVYTLSFFSYSKKRIDLYNAKSKCLEILNSYLKIFRDITMLSKNNKQHYAEHIASLKEMEREQLQTKYTSLFNELKNYWAKYMPKRKRLLHTFLYIFSKKFRLDLSEEAVEINELEKDVENMVKKTKENTWEMPEKMRREIDENMKLLDEAIRAGSPGADNKTIPPTANSLQIVAKEKQQSEVKEESKQMFFLDESQIDTIPDDALSPEKTTILEKTTNGIFDASEESVETVSVFSADSKGRLADAEAALKTEREITIVVDQITDEKDLQNSKMKAAQERQNEWFEERAIERENRRNKVLGLKKDDKNNGQKIKIVPQACVVAE